MRSVFTLSITLLVLLLCGCGQKEIVYEFREGKEVFAFELPNPDTLIRDSIRFTTMEVNTAKNEPVWIHFILSENTPDVKKLTSIKTSLSEINDNGQYTDLPVTSDLDIEYFNGKDQVKISKKDNNALLNTLIDWKTVNYSYEFLKEQYVNTNNSVSYTSSYHFRTESYPDTLRLAVELTWENGSRKYETYLTKREYEGRQLNPKY